MRIVFLSDTHGQHHHVGIPDGDMIVHAGDISSRGEPEEVRDFLDWFSGLPHPHKVFVGGNHDFFLEDHDAQFRKFLPPNCVYLLNEAQTVAGIRIWGSPITPWFMDWAFNRDRGPEILDYWKNIPGDTELLITHGPPYGILDRTFFGAPVGCTELLESVQQIRPKIHVFGHIHESYGQFEQDGTLFLNVSILNRRYEVAHKPVVIEWKA